jgi:hypothetical protein
MFVEILHTKTEKYNFILLLILLIIRCGNNLTIFTKEGGSLSMCVKNDDYVSQQ